MDILSRISDSKETIDYFGILQRKIDELVSPVVFNPSALNYGEYISSLGYYIHCRARDIIKETLEEMDDYFFKLKGRSKRYYSKGYRKREIITLFGHIIYYRHEYVDKHTGKPFIYVDEKIGLHRRDRYDPVVCAKLYERYAYTNSMINVGKDIGLDLNTVFNLCEDRILEAIPRQTIWKILHRFKKIDLPITELETPSILYIMADEKYIPSQYNDGQKLMTKEIIVHEGIKTIYKSVNKKTGQIYTRNELINPRRFIGYDLDNLFDLVNDYINETYDVNKIKKVYLMGDGGSWIESGLNEIKGYSYSTSYGLDKFHYCLAINTISKDENIKSLLYDYSIHGRKKDFETLVNSIIINDPLRKETIKDKATYIINHFKQIKTMYKDIKIGCAMEQAISHDIMSEFTSIPKAYSKKWLPFYLNERQNYLNGYDLRKTYLAALDKTLYNSEENEVTLKKHLNTSFFDNQIKDETYSLSKVAAISITRH